MEFFKNMSRWVRPSSEEADEMRAAVETERVHQERAEAERRVHERVRLEAEVTGFSETNFFTGFTEDISEGGLFIATHCPAAVGSRIEVSVNVGDGEPVVLHGEVAWHRGQGSDVDGCGVRFVDLTEPQVAALGVVLKKLDREPLFYDLDN